MIEGGDGGSADPVDRIEERSDTPAASAPMPTCHLCGHPRSPHHAGHKIFFLRPVKL